MSNKIKIYTTEECIKNPRLNLVTIEPYIVGKQAPVVLVCPGGSYTIVFDHNADLASACVKKGLNAFVLKYSVALCARYPNPLKDVARAIQYIKANAEKYDIDGNNISILGTSAGGHLCAMFGAKYKDFEVPYLGINYDLRPRTVILAYPVISMQKITHKLSRLMLLGPFAKEEKKVKTSAENCVTSSYPPTFIWHCKDDNIVNYQNSLNFIKALEKNNVEFASKIYNTGGHGTGLAIGLEPEGWFDLAYIFMKKYI